mmetsp:Transcript_13238/g.41861  ORF Transcript_13238/g.41861 Transcript_13238/m.41861 type:complete len:282 (+) Transcript_13238:193-1038(+)
MTVADDAAADPHDASVQMGLLRIELDGYEKEKGAGGWATDECLKRYLRARSWNVAKALKMITETIDWRASFKPEEIKWDHVKEQAVTGKMYRMEGTDKGGRPVVVMRPRNENTKDHDGQIKHLVYTIESAIDSIPPGSRDAKMTWVIDFKGYTMSKAPPMKTSIETLNILQCQYPERLGKAILYDPPMIFGVFWKMISPFIDPVTKSKIIFVYPKEEAKGAAEDRMMATLFDIASLESDLGGSGPPGFDFDKYSQRMVACDAKRGGASEAQSLSPAMLGLL